MTVSVSDSIVSSLVLGLTAISTVSAVVFVKLQPDKKPVEKKGAEGEEGKSQNCGEKVWVLVRGRMVLRRKKKAVKEEVETAVEVVSQPGPQLVQKDKEEGEEMKAFYYVIQAFVRYYCVMALFYQFILKSIWRFVKDDLIGMKKLGKWENKCKLILSDFKQEQLKSNRIRRLPTVEKIKKICSMSVKNQSIHTRDTKNLLQTFINTKHDTVKVKKVQESKSSTIPIPEPGPMLSGMSQVALVPKLTQVTRTIEVSKSVQFPESNQESAETEVLLQVAKTVLTPEPKPEPMTCQEMVPTPILLPESELETKKHEMQVPLPKPTILPNSNQEAATPAVPAHVSNRESKPDPATTVTVTRCLAPTPLSLSLRSLIWCWGCGLQEEATRACVGCRKAK